MDVCQGSKNISLLQEFRTGGISLSWGLTVYIYFQVIITSCTRTAGVTVLNSAHLNPRIVNKCTMWCLSFFCVCACTVFCLRYWWVFFFFFFFSRLYICTSFCELLTGHETHNRFDVWWCGFSLALSLSLLTFDARDVGRSDFRQ